MRKVGIFGWGIVAPQSPNVERFAANLASSRSWLAPFDGFGPAPFLVGAPDFRFEDYKGWVDERFKPSRFPQLVDKMDPSTHYAIGAFIQSLEQNPGIEAELRALGELAHVYVGTGLGSLTTIYDSALALYRGQRAWNRFWAQPQRNAALAAYSADPEAARKEHVDIPPEPARAEEAQRDGAEERWWAYWMAHSEGLQEYLKEFQEIEALKVEGEVEAGKISLMKKRRRRHARLKTHWGAPDPPWKSIPTQLLWNIPNTPASQISMLGLITGMTIAPVAACSTFGVTLKMAMDAIDRGAAKAVVIGATDGPPHPLTVGAFYTARVLAGDGQVSKPLSGLQGTHVSGGAAIWIVGDWEHMTARGFRPLGMEPVGVGVSSDADHIITPSKEGPTQAIVSALENAAVRAADIGTWDLHATATPGDYLEVDNMRGVLPEEVLVTARKGTFGHGMSAAGGWELMAQYLGFERGKLFPTPLRSEELNPEIGRVHQRFVFDQDCALPEGLAGKLSMGIGGVNACVVSRPL